MRHATKRRIRGWAVKLVLAVLACIVLYPLLWMIAFSFGNPEGSRGAAALLPRGLTLEGYRAVFETTPFWLWLRNSFAVASIQTALQVFIGYMAAYAFARFPFPGRSALFYFVLATMVIPAQALMIPMFVTINSLKMINTWAGVIVPFIASGYAIFMLRQFLSEVPQALVDSARVDGCDEGGILWHIYLPLSVPSIAALAVILFVNHWNEYYWPLLVLNEEKSMTLPIALVRFKNEGIIEWMPTLAAATLATMPVIAIFLATQKSFVEGFAASGIKG
jgi:multiple sugar transport system permease protein/sn-glycerol 3-phosphate transport system permease protein